MSRRETHRMHPSLFLSFRVPSLVLLLAGSVGFASADEPFRLGGPLMSRVDWSARGLAAGDVDGDGRQDLALINNDEARIDVLYQRTPAEMTEAAKRKLGSSRWEPVLENAPFLKESVTTGDYMYDLAVLDVNGDGRADIVYTGKRDRLSVKLQTAPGTWEDDWTYDRSEPNANVGSLAVEDVDGDGVPDLVAMSKDGILLFQLGGALTTLPTPVEYRVGEENPQQLAVIDLNGDGRKDLAYVAQASERALRVRYQDEEGGFGPEFAVPVAVGASDWAVLGDGKDARLVTIKRTRSEVSFQPLGAAPGSEARRRSLPIRNHPAPKTGVSEALYAVGDYDGDGLADVLVADPDGAAVHLYVQGREGELKPPRPYPSLQGITSIAAFRPAGESRDAIVVCSEKEGMVGLSRLNDAGRIEFPTNIDVPGQPIVATAADVDGDGAVEVIVATKDGRRFNLEILQNGAKGWQALKPVKLGSIKRDPTALLAQDVNGDGAPDLVMFIPREPVRIFLHDPDGKKDSFVEAAENDSVRTSQFEGVLPDRFGIGDFDRDGRPELLVSGKGFVRAYRIGKEGALEIVDQANARSSQDELAGPTLFDLDGDGTEELLAFHAAESALQVLERDESGLYRYRESLEMAPLGLTRVEARNAGGAAGTRLLFFGKDRFWSVPPVTIEPAAGTARSSYRTDLDGVRYTGFALGDLNHDGRDDVVMIDGTKNVLDVLGRGADGEWESELFFTVFEKNPFSRSNRGAPIEPREMLVGDFDDDGRDDLVLLCHDRVLLFPQGGGEGRE